MNLKVRLYAVLLPGLLLFAACGQELLLPAAEETTVRLTLRGGCQPFDDAGTKAAELSWNEGDRIFVRSQGASAASASVSIATREPDGSWTFRYRGRLSGISSVQCYFFQNALSYTDNEVQLSSRSAIYEDREARLLVDEDGNVELTTYLRPKTGRIRFLENRGQPIEVSGLSWYKSFDLTSFTFDAASADGQDFPTGENSYFYGFFEEGSDRKLTLRNGPLCFSRSFGEAVLRAGASGYLTVPQHNRYEGWTLENPDGLDDISSIEIPDANFRAWLLEHFDTDGDGMLSQLEKSNITEIYNNRCTDVTSLAGIEHFPNLRRLSWTGWYSYETGKYEEHRGLLTAVDLSHNPELQYVDLSFNQLSDLDLSSCTQLTDLYCYTNQLSALDLTPCTQLRSLTCYGNQLSALDLTPCSQLTDLSCGNNQLSALDLTPCPQLTYLSCSSNRLSALDLTPCPQLTVLYCNHNQLSALDLTPCTQLIHLDCGNNQLSALDLTPFTQLTILDCYNNRLSALDLSPCPQLTYLSCYSNQLSALDLTPCTQLTYLYCYSNQLSVLDLTPCSQLTELYCYTNQLSALDLSPCPQLTRLDCERNQLSTLDLSGLSLLDYLYCSNNPLTTLDLSPCPVLRSLYCENAPLTGILDLTNNPLLEQLSISSDQLDEIWLKTGVQIRDLRISDHIQLVYR